MKKLLALLLAFLLPLSAMAEWNDENNIVVQLHGVSFYFTPIEGLCVTRMTSPEYFSSSVREQKGGALRDAHDLPDDAQAQWH